MIKKYDKQITNEEHFFNSPIRFQYDYIHSPVVDDLKIDGANKIGSEKYTNMLLPFRLIKELFMVEMKELSLIEIYFLDNYLNTEKAKATNSMIDISQDLVYKMSNALKYFFKTDDVVTNFNDYNFIINGSEKMKDDYTKYDKYMITKVDKESFKELQEIILQITCSGEIELEEEEIIPDYNGNENMVKMHKEELEKERQKKAKEMINHFDVLNYIVHETHGLYNLKHQND